MMLIPPEWAVEMLRALQPTERDRVRWAEMERREAARRAALWPWQRWWEDRRQRVSMLRHRAAEVVLGERIGRDEWDD